MRCRGAAIVLFVVMLAACGSDGSSRGSLEGLTTPELQAQKLRVEIEQIESETDRENSAFRRLLAVAPLGTIVVGLVGAFVTVWKQVGERRADREQRRDERFAEALGQLSGETAASRAGAAVALQTFLEPRYASFHDQVYRVVLANLKIEEVNAVKDQLVETFVVALRRQLEAEQRSQHPDEAHRRDFARAWLRRAHLADLDLGNRVDIGFTDLYHANLTNAQLPRARGYKANLEGALLSKANLRIARMDKSTCRNAYFHGTQLQDAHFKGSDLRGARFEQAHLQAAHLERADLRGARFDGADLNDAYLLGADLDNAALQSIRRAQNYRKAHFDPEAAAALGLDTEASFG